LGLGSLETAVEGGDTYPVMIPEQGQVIGCGCERSREENWTTHFLLVDSKKTRGNLKKQTLKNQHLILISTGGGGGGWGILSNSLMRSIAVAYGVQLNPKWILNSSSAISCKLR
jgi:hypothetical protein